MTKLPYNLGGKDDPHFQDNSAFPSILQSAEDARRANEHYQDEDQDYPWSLRDEGRSFDQGESYSERNT